MLSTISTKKPVIPEGFRKLKFCTGGYKSSILGKELESEYPIWAEPRYDKNATFEEDRKFFRLYTFEKI